MTRPLRFCLVTTFYPPHSFGGDGVFVQQLARELARRGHRVDVVHCVDSYRLLSHRKPQKPATAEHPNITVHALRSPLGSLAPLAVQQTGRPMLRYGTLQRLLSGGYEVIHHHNISLAGGPGILKFGSAAKLYTAHEHWLFCPMHLRLWLGREVCSRRRCFVCSLFHRRPPQLWRYTRLMDAALQQLDALIVPSRFSENLHRQWKPWLPLVRLPNFVPDTGGPQPATCRSPAGSYFLFVGRLERVKGVQTLIPLFREHPSAELRVVGRGSQEKRLRRLTHGLTNVRFLGYRSGSDLHNLIRGAVAVIVPSLCEEVSPLVVLEAFREGTPALVRDLGGMMELAICNGGAVAFRDNRDLWEIMDRLRTDPRLRHDLGAQGRHVYLREHSPDVHLERYLALIAEIRERKRKQLRNAKPG